jgi:hypothetical protein
LARQVADEDEEETAPVPPSAEQVARRALVLVTVSLRGILEGDPDRGPAAAFWERAAAWWRGLRLDGELEPEEAELLRAPFGRVPPQARVNASWRAEALAVLAWALGRATLPPHDEQSNPAAISGELGLLSEETVLAAPRLRPAGELEAYRQVALTVHWRVREFSLNPRSIDFAAVCEKAWFGPLSLEGVALVDGDLAIGGVPIARAAPADLHHTMSIAQERHQAINWLVDASQPLSETDTGT